MFSSATGGRCRGHRADPRPGPPEASLRRLRARAPAPEEEAEGRREGRIQSRGSGSCNLTQGSVGCSSSMVFGVSLLRQKSRSGGRSLPSTSHSTAHTIFACTLPNTRAFHSTHPPPQGAVPRNRPTSLPCPPHQAESSWWTVVTPHAHRPGGPQETLKAPTGCRLLWGGQRHRLWVIGQRPRRLVKGWDLRHCIRLQVKGLSLRQKVKRHDLGCDQVRGCIQLLLGLR